MSHVFGVEVPILETHSTSSKVSTRLTRLQVKWVQDHSTSSKVSTRLTRLRVQKLILYFTYWIAGVYQDYPQRSLKLQVSFAKEPYKRGYILQKRPIIWCVSGGVYRDYPQPQLRIMNMGWLRLVGSLKLQVSFAKEPYKTGYILQKRPTIWCVSSGVYRDSIDFESKYNSAARPNQSCMFP